MPRWIHDRAEHLLAENPSMPKSMAFAVATQQSHALGKSPKSFGTAEGRETAKEKFDTPKDDKKTANPGNLESPKLSAAQVMMREAWPFYEKRKADELEAKLAAMAGELGTLLRRGGAAAMRNPTAAAGLAGAGLGAIAAGPGDRGTGALAGGLAGAGGAALARGAVRPMAAVAKAPPALPAAPRPGFAAPARVAPSMAAAPAAVAPSGVRPIAAPGGTRPITVASGVAPSPRPGFSAPAAATPSMAAPPAARAAPLAKTVSQSIGSADTVAGPAVSGRMDMRSVSPISGISSVNSLELGKAINPTLHDNLTSSHTYGKFLQNPELHQLVMNSQAVKDWGVTPTKAIHLAMASAPKMSPEDAIRHVMAPKTAASRLARSALLGAAAGGALGGLHAYAKGEREGDELLRGAAMGAGLGVAGGLGLHALPRKGGWKPPAAPPKIPPKWNIAREDRRIDVREKKADFAVSQFSGDLGPGPGLPYASGLPPFRVEPFKKPKEKLATAPLTPASRLSTTQSVGLPKVTTPAGPSIAQQSKPQGYGTPISGATK